MLKQNIIPIFFSFDNNYVVPAAVAFWSLLNHADSNVFYEMYVLHHDIIPENEKLLLSVVDRFKNARLKFIDTKGFMQTEWQQGNVEGHNKKDQFTSETFIKCFAARFFPQYDKIIYSDVDVVFMDDISEIYNIDLKNNYVAGVKDPFLKYSSYELSHLKPIVLEFLKDCYLCGGIWVLNLDLIRKDNLENKMLKIIADDSIVKRWPDQDIMNIACEGRVTFLPLNYIAYPYMLDLLKKQNFISHYTRDELWDSILKPKIVHYAATKPWKANVRYGDIWWDVFYYLNLPQTLIFQKPCSDKNKKIRKYKRYTFVFLGINIVLISIIFGMLL